MYVLIIDKCTFISWEKVIFKKKKIIALLFASFEQNDDQTWDKFYQFREEHNMPVKIIKKEGRKV